MINLPRAHVVHDRRKWLAIMVLAMAAFLNQAQVMLGVNVSLSDGLLIVTLISMIICRKLFIPLIPLIFFLCLSAFLLVVSTFFAPSAFYLSLNSHRLIIEYIKLVMLFSYYILGYNTTEVCTENEIAKAYSVTAVAIGVLGVITMMFRPRLLNRMLFLDGIRFQGLMNDPNYFSVLQVSSIPYFSRTKALANVQKYACYATITISVLLSGSKTGALTLACYAALRSFRIVLSSKLHSRIVIYRVLVALLSLLIISVSGIIPMVLRDIAFIVPASRRIIGVFTDFSSSLSSDGSDRSATWLVATAIIRKSPILGIGIATYTSVAGTLANITTVAHNTYLQMLAEWGSLWTSLFFLCVVIIMTRISLMTGVSAANKAIRDVLVIFLIGSLGVSLNNARMFWFFLGVITTAVARPNHKTLTTLDTHTQ